MFFRKKKKALLLWQLNQYVATHKQVKKSSQIVIMFLWQDEYSMACITDHQMSIYQADKTYQSKHLDVRDHFHIILLQNALFWE